MQVIYDVLLILFGGVLGTMLGTITGNLLAVGMDDLPPIQFKPLKIRIWDSPTGLFVWIGTILGLVFAVAFLYF